MSSLGAAGTDQAGAVSDTVVQLMKGVVYRDRHEVVWQHLQRYLPQIRDHFAVPGLTVVIDEAEGYAYLRSRPDTGEQDGPPRLIPRRSLSFHVSLLLALLRKKLAEFDASSVDTRLVLSRDQIVETVRLFLPDTSNEARIVDQIDSTIGKVAELGFLRKVPPRDDTWEVRRIIKAFIDAEWLADFDARLAEYAAQLIGDAGSQQAANG